MECGNRLRVGVRAKNARVSGFACALLSFRYGLGAAGKFMTTALRGPLQNHFWKKRRPRPYRGGENSGNALEASNASNYRIWGIPAVLLSGIPGKLSESVSGVFQNVSGISSGNSQPYWGCDPLTFEGFLNLRKLSVVPEVIFETPPKIH